MLDMADTIAAVASASGGASRGILRLSGPQVLECVGRMFTSSTALRPYSARRYRGQLLLAGSLGVAPCDLYLWPTNRSYTQQPTAELHLPGSPPILQSALQQACRHGARLAQPGEFTLRAFLAGRLDLTQAEGVLGVIDAHNQRELEVALQQLAGGLAKPLHALRDQLLNLLAHLEAGLDFVEEDIEFITAAELGAQLGHIHDEVAQLVEQMRRRDSSTDAFRIVLAGPPNAGKSSLLNALAATDAALVSPIAGTTRDYVTQIVSIAGLRCQLIDTAGLAAATNTPDAQAESFSHAQIKDAHLVLLCHSSVDSPAPLPRQRDPRAIVVVTKSDLLDAPIDMSLPEDRIVVTSAVTGAGLEQLRDVIGRRLRDCLPETAQVVATTSIRCRESLRSAASAMGRAQHLVAFQGGEELVAAELRLALEELGHVVGAVYTEDLLDRIFSRFCIGK